MPRHPAPANASRVSSTSYEIRIKGKVGKSIVASFGDFDAELEPVETVLRGPVADQAALHGLLARIERLGLELLEIRRVREPQEAMPGRPPARDARGRLSRAT
jgi:hypothetical protein